MTTLVTQTFNDGETTNQRLRFYKSTYVKAVRLHIYKKGELPSGSITLQVFDELTETLIGEKVIDHLDLNGISITYWQGMITFEFDTALFLTVYPTETYREYGFRFTANGVPQVTAALPTGEFSEPYVDFCKDYEKNIRNSLSDFRYVPIYGDYVNGVHAAYADANPLGIELYILN